MKKIGADIKAGSMSDLRISKTKRNLRFPLALGALLYALVMVFVEWGSQSPFIGEFVYNYYFLSLLDGRFDVPIQIVGLEGHYTTDGLAFVYHGLGPILTRLLAYPFIDLTQIDLTAFTIWLFATAGSSAIFLLVHEAMDEQAPKWANILLWVLVWVTSPGLMLVSNGSFFHEPISLAYACFAIYCLLLWRLGQHNFASGKIMLVMALVVALTIFARPHVALGLGFASVAIAVVALARHGRRVIIPLLLCGCIVALGGAGYLFLNAIRFGSALTVDGSTQLGGQTVYGFVYWGFEPETSVRFVTSAQEGRFAAVRIPSNILSNYFAPSLKAAREWQGIFLRGHYVRLEWPILPVIALWLPWVVLAGTGLLRRGLPKEIFWAMLVAALPITILILAYPTVTMRYRAELWPLLFVLGLSGGLAIIKMGFTDVLRRRAILLTSLSVIFCAMNVVMYSKTISWSWGEVLSSYENCEAMVLAHSDFGEEDVKRLCILNSKETDAQKD